MAARGIAAAKMVIVLNTPDEAIFGAPVSLPRPPAAAGKPFTLIYHGSILERYGLDLLIEAVPLLASEIPNLRVEVYGFGDFSRPSRRWRRGSAWMTASASTSAGRWRTCPRPSPRPISASCLCGATCSRIPFCRPG